MTRKDYKIVAEVLSGFQHMDPQMFSDTGRPEAERGGRRLIGLGPELGLGLGIITSGRA